MLHGLEKTRGGLVTILIEIPHHCRKFGHKLHFHEKIVLLYKKILGYNNSYCETLTKYSSESW